MATFELDRYLKASRKLDLSGIDFEQVREHPLPRDIVRSLTYMMDIETHTVIYLRDLLATRAADDPEVTAFLSMWVYEEFWHGEALGKFLQSAGERFTPERTAQIRRTARAGHAITNGLKGLATRAMPEFIALHMTWGAINELSTLHGYQRVIAQTQHPVLTELLSRIIKDERRHYAFYFNQARMRLADSERAQRVTRWVLGRFWAPVGTGVRPQAETDLVITTLFGDEEGARDIRTMEHELSKLPGLHGMRLITRARNAALDRMHGATPHARTPHIAIAATF